MPIVSTGQFTIVDVNDGATVSLTNESRILNADSAGNISSFAGVETYFQIKEAGVDTTSTWKFYISGTGGGITYRDSDDTSDRAAIGSTNGLLSGIPGYVKVTGLTQDLSYLDITAEKGGITYVKRFSVAKIRNGANGAPGADGTNGTNGAPGATSQGLVVNGDVETGSSTGWIDFTGSVVTGNAYTGTYSIRIASLSGGPNCITNSWPVVQYEVYKVSCFVKRDESSLPTADASIGVRFYDSAGSQIGSRLLVKSASKDAIGWQTLTGEVVVTEATAVTMAVCLGESNGTAGHWFFDNTSATLKGLRGTLTTSASIAGTAWSDSSANAAVVAAGGIVPIQGDIVTLYNNAQNFSQTRTRSSAGTWTVLTAVFGGDVIVDNTLTASKIDTRGLTIKDSAGNIVFDVNTKVNKNLIKGSWTYNTTGSQTGYNVLGTSAGGSNSIDLLTTPDGARGNVWVAISGSAAGDYSEGGWGSTTDFAIDHTKPYRFTAWIKRVGSGSTGSYYLGCGGSTVRNLSNSVVDTNPYFLARPRTELPEGVWCLAVGFVYPSGYTGTANTNAGGLFNGNTGAKIVSSTDFKWVVNQTVTNHRSFQYYTSAAGTRTEFFDPRVEVMDGSEASIAELLSMGNISARNKVTGSNVSTFIENAAIGDAQIGNYIKSTNFNGTIDSSGNLITLGTAGWAISKNGGSVFDSTSIRGQITAAQIDTANLTVSGALKVVDSSGSTLFSVGTPLDFSRVGGSTKPANNATKNVFSEGLLANRPTGSDGDLFYATDTDTLYQKVSGSWTIAANKTSVNTTTGEISGVASGSGTKVANTAITIDGTGAVQGIAAASSGVKIANNAIGVVNGVLTGTGTAGVQVDNTYQTIGQNLIPHSDQTNSIRFITGYNPNSAVISAVTYTAGVSGWDTTNYVLGGTTTKNVFILQSGRVAGNTIADGDMDSDGNYVAIDVLNSDLIPVIPGQRICGSIYFQLHRCRVRVFLSFIKADGSITSTNPYPFGDFVTVTPALANTLANYVRGQVVSTAPPDAAFVKLFFRKYDTFSGQDNSYVFFAAPQLEVLSTNGSASPYQPGPPVNVTSLGYSGDLDAQRNTRIEVNASGQITGIGSGVNTTVANTQIAVNASGQLTGIGSGNTTTVANNQITVSTSGILAGIGTSNVQVDNSKVGGVNMLWGSQNGPHQAGPGAYGQTIATLKLGDTFNPFGLKPGEDLVVSADLWQDQTSLNAGQYSTIYLFTYSSDGNWTASAANSVSLTTPFRASGTITLPAAANMYGVGIGVWHQGGTDNNIGTVYADRVQVERGKVATLYAPGAEPGATSNIFTQGTIANRPTGTDGDLFYATDQSTLYQNIAGTWVASANQTSINASGQITGVASGSGTTVANTAISISGGAIQGIGTGAGTAVANSAITISSGAIQGIGTGAGTAVANSSITISSGAIQGIGTGAGTAVANSAITIDSGAIQGIGTGAGTAVANNNITLSSTGQLQNAGGGQITTLTASDTRSTNEAPSWYSVGITEEFKTRTAIGAPGISTYGILRTEKGYADFTGGAVVQTFKTQEAEYKRTSVAGNYTQWGPWTPKIDRQIASDNIDRFVEPNAIGISYIANSLQSNNYVTGTSGWKIEKNTGNAEFGNAIIRGQVFASSGTFSGSLSGATGTFTGEISAGSLNLNSASGSTTHYNPGTYSITVPTGISTVKLTLIGGGGGGSNNADGAGGGGGGAVTTVTATVTSGQTISLTVGAGGAVNNNGGNTTATYSNATWTAGGGTKGTGLSGGAGGSGTTNGVAGSNGANQVTGTDGYGNSYVVSNALFAAGGNAGNTLGLGGAAGSGVVGQPGSLYGGGGAGGAAGAAGRATVEFVSTGVRIGTLANADGSANIPVNTVINGSAKAWVNFNGQGTGSERTIRASFNVSSVTDIGVGHYTINFINNFADTNYVMSGSGRFDTSNVDSNTVVIGFRRNSTSIQVNNATITTIPPNSATVPFDCEVVTVAFFR